MTNDEFEFDICWRSGNETNPLANVYAYINGVDIGMINTNGKPKCFNFREKTGTTKNYQYSQIEDYQVFETFNECQIHAEVFLRKKFKDVQPQYGDTLTKQGIKKKSP